MNPPQMNWAPHHAQNNNGNALALNDQRQAPPPTSVNQNQPMNHNQPYIQQVIAPGLPGIHITTDMNYQGRTPDLYLNTAQGAAIYFDRTNASNANPPVTIGPGSPMVVFFDMPLDLNGQAPNPPNQHEPAPNEVISDFNFLSYFTVPLSTVYLPVCQDITHRNNDETCM
ncbi:hypothetical protein COOONC_13513 [Cooperia oncophora]